jgi:RNA polymerase sigma-70 factor (ECF subfamily)
MEVMAPDVVLIADGSGLADAALSPIHGAERVANVLARGKQFDPTFDTTSAWLNGAPAGRIECHGVLSGALSVVVENGLVTQVYLIRNPRKLTRLDERAELTR